MKNELFILAVLGLLLIPIFGCKDENGGVVACKGYKLEPKKVMSFQDWKVAKTNPILSYKSAIINKRPINADNLPKYAWIG